MQNHEKYGSTVAVDFETFYDKKAGYSVSSMTPHDYVNDPRFDPYLVSVVGETGEEYVGSPFEFDWKLLTGARLVMHNASFDGIIINRLIELGRIPEFERELIDTADMCAFMCVPRSLAGACKALLGMDVSKAVRTAMDGRKFEFLNQFEREAMLQYAADDSRLCLQLFRTYGDKWPQWERDISRLNREATWRGIRIDVKAAREGLAMLEAKKEASAAALPWSEEDAKAGSRKQFLAYVKDLGLPVPSSVAKTSPVFIAWADRYKDQYPFIQARLDYASLGTHISRLKAMVTKADSEDVLRYESLYYGSHCLTGDHEVLTRGGWVRLDQWQGGEIMQWHNVTKALDFLPATANMFRNTERAMVEIDAPFLKAVMTLGHTVPRYTCSAVPAFQPMKAEQLLSSRGQINIPVGGMYAGTGVITPEQMRVLVATQADGSFSKQYGELIFTLRKQRKIDRVQMLLTAAELPYKLQYFPSAPTQARITVCRRFLPPWLCRERKIFGPWLLDSTQEAREAFLDEYPRWDGWSADKVTPNGVAYSTREYYSSVLENVRWVTTMLHITGRSAGKLGVRPTKGTHQAGYRVIRREPGHTCVYAHLGQAREIAAVPEVYCPTTETGWFLCRYKDTIFVTGNTGRCSGSAREEDENKSGKANLYNIPKGDNHGLTHGVDLRGLHIPRPGHCYMIYDYGQIEARILHWLAGNTSFLARAATENIYQAAAKTLGWYPADGVDLKGEDPQKYALAKACLTEETLVLTESGFKRIVDVLTTDRVWDGETWVTHEGVVCNGTRTDLVEINGERFTSDHKIYGPASASSVLRADQFSPREKASALAWREASSPGTSGDNLWSLTRCVFSVLAKELWIVCCLQVSRLWKDHNTVMVQRKIRSDDPLSEVRNQGGDRSQSVGGMGEGTR